MKKVLFIEAAYLKGGIETFILNVAKNIDQKKFELYLLKKCEIPPTTGSHFLILLTGPGSNLSNRSYPDYS